MHKHTPAPWKICRTHKSNLEIWANGTPKIATVPDVFVSINEQNANAEIIALAPAMFNALLDLLNARMESSEAFRRMSYSPNVQAVFNAVEEAAK